VLTASQAGALEDFDPIGIAMNAGRAEQIPAPAICGIRENTGNFIESGPRSRQVAAKTQPISAHYGQISLRRNNRESFADNREFYRMSRQFRA
jgi:hypothetical protein